MTKMFEEDLNKKLNSEQVPMHITQLGCSMTRKTYIETNWIFDTYANWHPDEQFQKAIELAADYHQENENINQINSQLTKENEDLKSQLQQQNPRVENMDYCEPSGKSLPVVPEDVAKWIEDLKSKGYGPLKNPGTYGEAISDLSDESLEKILTWISQHQEEFMRAWLDGYTIEKPKTLVSPCPVCGYKDVSSNFCSICGHKNEYVEDEK